jgi:uncharacterized membrane protein YgcG
MPERQDKNAPDVDGTAAAIQTLAVDGVTTFVLGVAVRNSSDAALRAMARAGGHARQGMTAYYTANEASELEVALDEVSRQVALCTFDLSTPPPAGAALTITVGGRSFPRNQRHVGDGWDVTAAGRSIALYGAACDAVQAGGSIMASYACGDGTRCDQAAMACVPIPGADGGAAPNPGQGMGTGGSGGSGGSSGGTDGGSGGSNGTGGMPTGQCPSGGCGVDWRCRYNAQCGTGGLCEGGHCRRACSAATDCGTGEACTDGRCRPGTSAPACAFNSDCGAGRVCVNAVCYGACMQPTDCTNKNDHCDRGLCRPNTGRVPSCQSKAECASGTDCVDGICRTACCFDTDCAMATSGSVCWTGYCFKPNEATPACFLNADCGSGMTCADATCH